MSKVTKHICDWEGCKTECPTDKSLEVFSHSESNGVDFDRWRAVFDLCQAHLLRFTQALIREAEVSNNGGVPFRPIELVKQLKIRFELH